MQGGGREARGSRAAAISNITGSAPTIRAATSSARLIYGFRISVLFGLILTHHLVRHRHRGRRGAGLFRRLDRLAVPALHRDLDLGALALSVADHLLGAGAGILRAARNPAAVLLGVARRAGARGIPARPQFRIYPGRARARRVERQDHVPASAAERDGGDAHLPAVHPVVLGDDADRARFPRLRPAARLAFARRIAVAGQGQCAGAVARPHRLLLHRDHAVASDLHRRSGARRLRSRERPSYDRYPAAAASRISRLRSGRAERRRWRSTASPSTSRRARPSPSSANPVPANPSPPCRCSSSCRIRRRAILPARSSSRARNCCRVRARDARRCAATTSPSSSRSR